ncbi:Uncharacterised protein [Vibrio cholerae]|nr:Uncharacterised protein [Vibrio cholerae]
MPLIGHCLQRQRRLNSRNRTGRECYANHY